MPVVYNCGKNPLEIGKGCIIHIGVGNSVPDAEWDAFKDTKIGKHYIKQGILTVDAPAPGAAVNSRQAVIESLTVEEIPAHIVKAILAAHASADSDDDPGDIGKMSKEALLDYAAGLAIDLDASKSVKELRKELSALVGN